MTERTRAGRRPTDIIELVLPRCGRAYSQGGCTAQLGVTGSSFCYNTIDSCQVPDKYLDGVSTVYFASNAGQVPPNHLPLISSVRTASPELNPIGGSRNRSPLGKRATLQATFEDSATSDAQIDMYWKGRYTGETEADNVPRPPHERSTFFRKLKARFPSLLGRELTHISAYMNPDGTVAEILQLQKFVVTGVSGPSADGSFSLQGQDVLTRAGDLKAQCPRQSATQLAAALTEQETSTIYVDDTTDFLAKGLCSIGGEIIYYSSKGASTLTGLVRAQQGTTLASHPEGANVQPTQTFSSQSVYQVLYTLLHDYAGIPDSLLDLDGWAAEAAAGYLPYVYTAVIGKPTGVETLLADFLQQAAVYLWFDTKINKVRLRAVRGVDAGSVPVFTEDAHIIAGSLSVKEAYDEVITRAVLHYGIRNRLGDVKDVTNFQATEIAVALEEEQPSRLGYPVTRTFASRWMDIAHGDAAAAFVTRLLGRYRAPPIELSFSVDVKDIGQVEVGSYVVVESQHVVSPSGRPRALQGQVMSATVEHAIGQAHLKVHAFEFEDILIPSQKTLIISGEVADVDVLTLYNATHATPLAENDELHIIVRAGAVVGATATHLYALTVGNNLPDNVTVTLTVESGGYIVGKGGAGGRGGDTDELPPIPGVAGTNGGPALRLQYPTTLEAYGTIGGGGGGGGAGAFIRVYAGGQAEGRGPGGGGGSGAGYTPSAAGSAGQDKYCPSVNVCGAAGLGGSVAAGGSGGAGGGADGLNVVVNEEMGYRGKFNVYGGWGGSGGNLGLAGNSGSAAGWVQTSGSTAHDWAPELVGNPLGGGSPGLAITGVTHIQPGSIMDDVRGGTA